MKLDRTILTLRDLYLQHMNYGVPMAVIQSRYML